MSGPTARPERDSLLTDFGKKTLTERYCLKGETHQDVFLRVARAYSDNPAHAERMYDYISQHWFMPSTPILSNGGTDRGLPISCYLNTVGDSMEEISGVWEENIWLGAGGGGIGTCWSNVRSVGEPVRGRGGSSGIIPFIRVMDSQTLAVSQGSLRRGAAAVYLDVGHPEIEEFLEIRKASGDFNRKSLNLHHGVVISDLFMQMVESDMMWTLIDPKSGRKTKNVRARTLWERLLELRVQTGEPYLLFEGNVHRGLSQVYEHRNARVTQSNLCSEILLETSEDRSAVCCLGSVNLRYYNVWSKVPGFVEDCLRFLDNVIEDFIKQTEGRKGFEKTRRSAMAERSVGLGVMGFHTFLQENGIAFESVLAKAFNRKMFTFIDAECDKANELIAQEKGPCPDAEKVGIMHRFSNTRAIAPTASISIIAGQASPCIEPWNTNAYVHKTLTGSTVVKNETLNKLLRSKIAPECEVQADEDAELAVVWTQIVADRGSVRNIDYLTDHEKEVFKTAWEIDQRWIIDLAADRTPLIDQGQSINLFLTADSDIFHLHMLHFSAWKRGVKSLYYLRSQSVQNAGVEADNKMERATALGRADYEECLSCQ